MSGKNKFGFAPVDATAPVKRRTREPGPMGAAVRDVAENLQEATEAKIEQRRQNATDAKIFREAQAEGRVLYQIPLVEIFTDDLPRDRLALDDVAQSDEMEELKASIRARGQREPVEVYVGPSGRYQLKKGWRRFTALSQLFNETKDDRFGAITARIEAGSDDRMSRYVDMVEENVVREDLTFAEMAQVAITAAQDESVDEIDPAELVSRLYGALHKTKRSYIKSFVFLLSALGDSLAFPKAIPRNLGVDVARALRAPEQAQDLRAKLEACHTAEDQNEALKSFIDVSQKQSKAPAAKSEPKQKFEFFVGKTKVTARQGECRLVSEYDFATMPKKQLEDAVRAFEEVLNGGPRIR
jgi:ParB family chromosome partitioning protein